MNNENEWIMGGPRGWSQLKDNGDGWLTNRKKKEKVNLVVSCPV